MKYTGIIFASWFSLLMMASCAPSDRNRPAVEPDDFEVVGYLFWSERTPDRWGSMNTRNIPYEYLTTINYAFVFPEADRTGRLTSVPYPDTLHALVREAHSHNVKVLISIGGFMIGDNPGVDNRFEVIANNQVTRDRFVKEAMDLVREFNLDGVDMDWEFPDAVEPSLSNFVLLMKELHEQLHPMGKKLTSAVEASDFVYTYGVDESVYQYVDWINIMGYDGDVSAHGYPNKAIFHSPYWWSEMIMEHWIDEKGLPREKAVLGVPFYGKGTNRFGGAYRGLLARGADPYADKFDSVYYNGIKTMKKKTVLAKKRGRGMMIWEISGDAPREYSLLRAINEAIIEFDKN